MALTFCLAANLNRVSVSASLWNESFLAGRIVRRAVVRDDLLYRWHQIVEFFRKNRSARQRSKLQYCVEQNLS